MNGAFYPGLSGVEQWGACERTVLACALARRVPWPGLKLLQRAVDAALARTAADHRLERDANDIDLLQALLNPPPHCTMHVGSRLRRLLELLPLLRPDNSCGAAAYVCAAPHLVQRALDKEPQLCRQLLAYLLVHPALDENDQRTLTQWLRYLENHISGNQSDNMWQQRIEPNLLTTDVWGSSTFRRTIGKNVEFRGIEGAPDPRQESFSKNGVDVDLSFEDEGRTDFDATIAMPKPRSNSLTPWAGLGGSSSAEDLSLGRAKPRSASLCGGESSLSGLSGLSALSGGARGSDSRLHELRRAGGRDPLSAWLKALRLHKYVWLFADLDYHAMLAIDDAYLEKLGVTKGARHKLLLSIKKLEERDATLDAIEAELASGNNVSMTSLLSRVRSVLLSPMPANSTLPDRIVTVLEMASPALSSAGSEALSLHCWLVERALATCAAGGLQARLRALRHRLPPALYTRLRDLPHRTPARWRGGAARGRGGARPYNALDALCLQMTQHAID